VIFKSSQSDRVICELVPPAQYDTVPAVGSMLTVMRPESTTSKVS